ncbi:hypothetical protein [Herbiconiux sp. UC225_62]|uniref:hypothetical protein n=1 Tax=Herbiconiux sp. UC225_62 TaxID=3350168 RepID=UPI0036D3D9D5
MTENALMRERGWWGLFAGIILAALIAYPLSAAVAFATHPRTQRLFGDALDDAGRTGFQAFWWIIALLLAALPFAAGFAVARLTKRGLQIVAAVVALLVIVIVVLAQAFVY